MATNVSDANFKKEVLEATLPVLVDFWAPWCGPCQMMTPIIEEISSEYKDKLKVCKLNVDEAQVTAAQYGIMSIPTLAVFKGGKIIDKVVGAMPKDALINKFKQYIVG
jgi:thioredoxin 1